MFEVRKLVRGYEVSEVVEFQGMGMDSSGIKE